MKASVALKRVQAATAALQSAGVTLNGLTLLVMIGIGEEGGKVLRIGDVAKRTGQPFSTVSRTLWELSEGGFLKYALDTQDRRQRTVSLTSSGRELIARFN